MAKEEKKKFGLSNVILILQLLLYTWSTAKSFIDNDSEGPWRIISLVMLIAFIIAMGAAIVMNIGDKRKMKSSAGDVKYAKKTTTNTIALIQLIGNLLGVLTAVAITIDTVTAGNAGKLRIAITVLVCAISLFSAIRAILKRTKKMKKAAAKHDAKKDKAAEAMAKEQAKQKAAEAKAAEAAKAKKKK